VEKHSDTFSGKGKASLVLSLLFYNPLLAQLCQSITATHLGYATLTAEPSHVAKQVWETEALDFSSLLSHQSFKRENSSL